VTRFRYRPERSHLGTIYRPVATVIVEHKEIIIELPLYIDSGADISMIPYRFGKSLVNDGRSSAAAGKDGCFRKIPHHV
jgi:hypothetical protein